MASRACEFLGRCLRQAITQDALSAQLAARSYCLGVSSTGTLNRFFEKATVSEAAGVPVRCEVYSCGTRRRGHLLVLALPEQRAFCSDSGLR